MRYSTLILIGIVFAKSALSQSAIGEYETFVFIAGSVSFFWLNGLLKALLPLSANQGKKGKTSIFSAFAIIQIFSILAAVFLYFLQPLFSEFLLNSKGIPEISLLLIFIVFGIPANMVEYYYLIKKRSWAIVYYAAVSFVLQFVLIVLPAVLGYGIKMSIVGLVLSSVLRYFWLWIIFISNKEIHLSPDFIRQNLKLGGPLVAATLLSGSAQFVDGFIVTSKFDEETFAVFRYGARELPLAMLLANALSNAMLPEFTNKAQLKENLEKLKKSILRLMHILFPLTAVLLLISKPLFPVIFNPMFADSAIVFNIYLLLVVSRMLMPQTILNGLKITKPILAASFLELVLNVVLSLVFVQVFGIAGIAFATFIAYLFEKVYLAIVVKQKLSVSLSEYLSINIYLLYSVGVFVIFIFSELIF
jgi:O-antigen/teichoic acid export membrane protein